MIKKIYFTSILIFAAILFVQAQNNNPESAFKYNLVAEPAIVEVSDNTTLNVKFDNGTVVNNYPNDKAFPNGAKPAYALGEYKILQGGGQLKANIAGTISFTYTAPSSVPKTTDQTVVQVSVELIPKNEDKKVTGGLPKIILYCTLYIVQNETAFELVMPEAGFDHSKFISNNPGGAAVLPIDPRIPPAEAARLRQQMEKMKNYQKAPQIESNVNFNGITSNASLFYDEKNNVSTIKFTQLGMQITKVGEGVNAGYNVTPHPSPVAIIVINFKGKPTKGAHPIAYLPEGVTFASIPLQRACECGHENKNNDPNDVDAPCSGQVIITEVTKDGFRGELMSRMYFANNGNHTSGYVTGKFYVLKANNN